MSGPLNPVTLSPSSSESRICCARNHYTTLPVSGIGSEVKLKEQTCQHLERADPQHPPTPEIPSAWPTLPRLGDHHPHHPRAKPLTWDGPITIIFLPSFSSSYFPVTFYFIPFVFSLLERLKAPVTLFPYPPPFEFALSRLHWFGVTETRLLSLRVNVDSECVGAPLAMPPQCLPVIHLCLGATGCGRVLEASPPPRLVWKQFHHTVFNMPYFILCPSPTRASPEVLGPSINTVTVIGLRDLNRVVCDSLGGIWGGGGENK
ncbi:hypothetical protein HispidOSU_015273 [Sigmodon hispidus]